MHTLSRLDLNPTTLVISEPNHPYTSKHHRGQWVKGDDNCSASPFLWWKKVVDIIGFPHTVTCQRRGEAEDKGAVWVGCRKGGQQNYDSILIFNKIELCFRFIVGVWKKLNNESVISLQVYNRIILMLCIFFLHPHLYNKRMILSYIGQPNHSSLCNLFLSPLIQRKYDSFVQCGKGSFWKFKNVSGANNNAIGANSNNP